MSLEHSPNRDDSPRGKTGLPSLAEILQDDPLFLEGMVDTREASRITGIPIASLETARNRGGGPRFVKRGKAVTYRRRTLLEYMAALGERTSTSDTSPQGAAA